MTSTSTSPYPPTSPHNNLNPDPRQGNDDKRQETTPTAHFSNNATMNLNNNPIGALSPESQRRSNIFGILHTESSVGATSSNALPPTQRRTSGDSRTSDSTFPARMSVGSLINRSDERENGAEGGPNMWNHFERNHHIAPNPYSMATENGGTNGYSNHAFPESLSRGHHGGPPRFRSISVETISDSDRDSDMAFLPGSFAPSQRPGRSGSAPVAIDGTDDAHRQIVDIDMEENQLESHRSNHVQEDEEGFDDDGREVMLDDVTSGEEDDAETAGNQIEANMDGDGEPDGEDDESDDDEESSSDDEDEEGSIDLEAEQDQDVGDSPVFISMRNGPLGISDLLLPPAAGNDDVRVKAEPGASEHEQVQSQESVLCVGSRHPTQVFTPLGSTPLAQVINSADIISYHGSSQLQDSQAQPAVPLATENITTTAEGNQEGTDTVVNLLVARPGKKKKVRAKSPSPPPPAAPKPRATIRVTFHLFDDNEGPDGLPVTQEINAGPSDVKKETQDHTKSSSMDVNANGITPMLTSPEKGVAPVTTPIEAMAPALPVLPTISPSSTDAAVSSAVPTAAPSAAPSVGSPTTRPQAELVPDSTAAAPLKASLPEHHGIEPKFRIVNFKVASIAQGKVDSDYYISPSGWNAIGSDADDDDDDEEDGDDDIEVDGAETKPLKNKKRKFQELLMKGGSSGAMKPEEIGGDVALQNMDTGGVDPFAAGAAPGSILQAMMGGSDQAELARLAAELDKKYNTTSKPKRKRVPQQDDYDYKDPFIDDSELQMDEPALLQRPVKTGYYVQKGAVELIKDEEEDSSPKKAKGKKQITLNLTKQPNSTKDSPTEVDDQNGEQPKKRKKMLLGRGFRPSKFGAASGNSSRQSLTLTDPVRDASNRLESLVYPTVLPNTLASVSMPASGTGATRGQTPAIKPISAAAPASTSKPLVVESASVTPIIPEPPRGPPKTLEEALSRLPGDIHAVLKNVNNITQALSDDDWKQIKAAKRFPDQFKYPMYEVGKKAVELGLVGDALYETLPLIIRYNRFTMKKYVLDKMKDYQTEYYETVKRETLPVLKAAIETTMEKQVLDYNAAQELYDAATRQEEDQARQEGREPGETGVTNPVKRVRWSDEMRAAYWRLMKTAENAGNFETQRADIHDRPHVTTAFLMRNQLYADIVPLFPEGWMSNQQLSRQMSSLKNKYEKQGNLQA